MNNSTLFIYPRYYYQFGLLQRLLEKISLPYIFLIGFIGLITNSTTVVLLLKNFIAKNLKNKWTLIALALSDLLFNIALLIRGTHDIFKGNSDRLCIIISFLSHLAELLSACYTVAFTIQRYTAVHYPLKAVMDRHSSPITSLFIIFLSSFIFCIILIRENMYIDCHEELQLRWFIADALLSFVIPFFLILIFNILIVSYIRRHSRSPIIVQSTMLRKKKHCKNISKIYQHDETCFTDNNTQINPFIHIEENELIELKNKKDENELIQDLENQIFRPSTSSSLYRLNSEPSANTQPSQSIFRLPILLKSKRRSSSDSAIGKPPTSLNENDIIAHMSTRTSQSIRVTRMLVLVSTCFLILNAPAHLCVIALKIYTVINTPVSTEHINQHINNETMNQTVISTISSGNVVEDQLNIHLLYMAVLFTQLIAYASYSINFFLYSFTGITFRTSLRQLIYKLRRH